MLSAGDFQDLAYWLIDDERADLWRMLRSVTDDMISGRLDPHRRPTVH